jgi:4-hydroxybenzoate polyprenyltransferase
VAFALVPTSFVVLALPGAGTPRVTVVAASGLLGASAHFTNAIKDLEADALTGVRGLPQRIGPRWSGVVSGVLLLAGAELPAAAVAFAGAAGAVAIGYVLLVLAGRVVRHAFSLNVLAVGLLVAAVVSSGSRIVV